MAQTPIAVTSGMVLRRQCACGNHSAGGECGSCRQQRSQQKPLAIGAADSPLEAEADRAAAAVMSEQRPTLARSGSIKLDRAADGTNGSGNAAVPSIVHEVLRTSGRPLDRATRAFMEPRFGHDFSHVRVHTDVRAEDSARAVGALAYTVGSDIVFGRDRFQPSSHAGRTLLAHELAHVMQQPGGALLQRVPDPAAVKDFDDRLAKLKKTPVYTALDAKAQKEIDEIADIVRKRDNVAYYATKLELLFSIPEQASTQQAADTSKETTDAAIAEAKRRKTPRGKAALGQEEAISKDKSRVFLPAQGRGATFLIDARDPTNIAVQVKVRLTKAGKGTALDVLHVKSLQDVIEKRAGTLGYSLDLQFVDKADTDVFSVDVDTSQWTVSGNWVGDDIGLVHELHHLLGLEEDRYDYIEAHAKNPKMKIPDRIHWFRTELSKVIDNNPLSIMSSGENVPLDDDVCVVAGNKTKVDIDACVQKRSTARSQKLQPGLSKAQDRVTKAAAALAGAKPGTAGADQQATRQQSAASIGEHVFGKPMSLPQLTSPVQALPAQLKMGNLHLVSAVTPGCDNRSALTSGTAPRIRLCPSFFGLGDEAQSGALLTEALHANSIGTVKTDTECSKPGCDKACGSETNAKAWVRFVECAAKV
jgi:hypothetical protein